MLAQNSDFQIVVQKILNSILIKKIWCMTEDIKLHQDSFPSCSIN